MTPEVFLVCALSLPALHHTRPAIVSHVMAKSEEERLVDWLRKNNPDADVFIHEKPHVEKLKENGFEQVPFTWRGNKIWIKRKPHTDQRPVKRQILVSA